ncbi:unnamed protein product [Hydatigera taeniaeformis]|uniref:CLASP_N domain-containing protein n=1 Tax=Hydatigena taeniaeformis TaxID=6205 RepID=A0A158REW5_HYDTA|nr:unnamed protein product [Hydatigera taeniaeformis]
MEYPTRRDVVINLVQSVRDALHPLDLFESINALANGDLTGKWAHTVATNVTQRMESCLRDVVVVVTAEEKIDEKLLVRTPQVTVMCAIMELLVMDSDFTLLLLGLNSFTNLISAIAGSKPREISQRDLNTLLINQSGDGYCWIFHLATNFLRIALSDPKRLIRTAGSQLVAKLLRLPKGSRSVIHDFAGLILGCHDDNLGTLDTVKTRLRKEAIDCVTTALLLCPSSEFSFREIVDSVIVPGLKDSKSIVRSSALDCLAVAVKVDSDALIDQVELQLPLPNSNNNAKREPKKGGQEEFSNHQAAVSLHSIVFQRHLPSLNSQFRLVRQFPEDSTVGMSSSGQVNCESPSSIRERRKPSAGRMHGNLRLPWDPRDSVVVVGSANGSSESCSFPFHNLPPAANAIRGSNFDEYKSSGRSPERSVSNQNSSTQSLECRSRTELRRSLNLPRASYCEGSPDAAVEAIHTFSHRQSCLLACRQVESAYLSIIRAPNLINPLAAAGNPTHPSTSTTCIQDRCEADEDTMMETGIEGHAPRGFARRSNRSRQGNNAKSLSSQGSRKKGGVEDLGLTRSGPQTPSQTPRLPHGMPSRRPPSIPRDGSLHRKNVRHHSPDHLSRLSQNHPSMTDCGRCRDVTSALNRIASADWEDKVDGLLSLSSLALKHPTAFSNSPDTYSTVIHAVTSECRNLRSQVSRQAVKTMADLFRGLGRLLDPHVDTCVRVLLVKTGEASAAFLRGEVAIALSDLVRSVNLNRALIALFQHGLGHKNAAVRRQCAIQASYLIESMGPSRVLQTTNQRGNLSSSSWGSLTTVCSGATSASNANPSATTITSASSQAVTERVIVALGKFLLDSNQETRYYGRRILATLQNSPDFERNLTRYLSGQMLRAVREATDYLRTKVNDKYNL